MKQFRYETIQITVVELSANLNQVWLCALASSIDLLGVILITWHCVG